MLGSAALTSPLLTTADQPDSLGAAAAPGAVSAACKGGAAHEQRDGCEPQLLGFESPSHKARSTCTLLACCGEGFLDEGVASPGTLSIVGELHQAVAVSRLHHSTRATGTQGLAWRMEDDSTHV